MFDLDDFSNYRSLNYMIYTVLLKSQNPFTTLFPKTELREVMTLRYIPGLQGNRCAFENGTLSWWQISSWKFSCYFATALITVRKSINIEGFQGLLGHSQRSHENPSCSGRISPYSGRTSLLI